MKRETITCEVIQDLLPLYEDDCCSAQSRKIVEDHLAQCPDCRKKSSAYRSLSVQSFPLTDPEADADLKNIRRGVRKITRWKRVGVASLCLLLLVFFAALPAWNYVQGSGLTYANLKSARTAYAFKNALMNGDYEKAYDYLDIERHYEDLLTTDLSAHDHEPENREAIRKGIEEVSEHGYGWYEQLAHEKFLQSMDTLVEANQMIDSCSNFRIEKAGRGWRVSFGALTDSGQSFRLDLDLRAGKISEIHADVDYLTYDFETMTEHMDKDLEQQGLILDRLYRFPTVNETVTQVVYGGTDWDWTVLFDY